MCGQCNNEKCDCVKDCTNKLDLRNRICMPSEIDSRIECNFRKTGTISGDKDNCESINCCFDSRLRSCYEKQPPPYDKLECANGNSNVLCATTVSASADECALRHCCYHDRECYYSSNKINQRCPLFPGTYFLKNRFLRSTQSNVTQSKQFPPINPLRKQYNGRVDRLIDDINGNRQSSRKRFRRHNQPDGSVEINSFNLLYIPNKNVSCFDLAEDFMVQSQNASIHKEWIQETDEVFWMIVSRIYGNSPKQALYVTGVIYQSHRCDEKRMKTVDIQELPPINDTMTYTPVIPLRYCGTKDYYNMLYLDMLEESATHEKGLLNSFHNQLSRFLNTEDELCRFVPFQIVYKYVNVNGRGAAMGARICATYAAGKLDPMRKYLTGFENRFRHVEMYIGK